MSRRPAFPRSDLGAGIAAVGIAETLTNLAGTSLIDGLGSRAVATTPLPVVERTIEQLGVTDKPFLRATIGGTASIAVGSLLARDRGPRAQLVLASLGLGAAALGRARLDAVERARRPETPLPPVATPLGDTVDGAEGWPHAEPLVTEVGRFYRTDVNLRPPSVGAEDWALTIRTADGADGRLHLGELHRLELRERDALLVCVHNRPAWDRLGQQRWTGVPVGEVLGTVAALPAHPERYDLVTEALDGYRQVIPLDIALGARSWVVVGMAGRPLPLAHGYPARVMTPGLVGQYNGVKWLSELRVVERGTEPSWWGERRSYLGEPSWPRGPVWVRPMARIDHPADTGMPPRLPRRPVRTPAGSTPFVGTAWAPPHGVESVELRVDGGAWEPCELAGEINGDSWRRWRHDVDLAPGRHEVQVRCHSANGQVQAGAPAEPFPLGVGVFHTVVLTAS